MFSFTFDGNLEITDGGSTRLPSGDAERDRSSQLSRPNVNHHHPDVQTLWFDDFKRPTGCSDL